MTETANKPVKVYMGIPSTGERLDVQTILFEQLRKAYAGRVEMVFPEHCVRRMFHDYARNGIVEEFLKTDCDVLWFLDSDVLPSGNVLDLVTKHYHKWLAAGAPYPLWMPDPTESDRQQKVYWTTYTKTPNSRGYGPAPSLKQGEAEIDGMATGCMFLKRELVERLSKPYFTFEYNPETRAMTMGEDLGFAGKLNELGVRFFVDYSIACGHYKKVNLLDVSNYAFGMANYKTNLFYETEVKPAVEKLKARIKALEAQVASQPKTGLVLPGHKDYYPPQAAGVSSTHRR